MTREAWTDERMDDLKDGMHRGFDEVRREFDKVDSRFEKFEASVDARFDRVDARFDELNRNLFLGMVTIVATLLAAILAKGVF